GRLAPGGRGLMACRSWANGHCCSVTLKRWIYLIGAVGVAAGVLAVIFRPEREPEYGGKRLSEWVDLIWKPKPKGITDERSYSIRRFDETPVAVRSMGTNALPHLLKWSRYEPRSWQGELYRTLN